MVNSTTTNTGTNSVLIYLAQVYSALVDQTQIWVQIPLVPLSVISFFILFKNNFYNTSRINCLDYLKQYT